jgi:uncharacterized protein (DUF58 family)
VRAPRLAVRAAASAWARRRQGTDTLPVRLAGRRIYILPTRAGVAYAVMLTGMLLAGLNYGNSVALLLAFVLGSLGGVAMFQCHRRLLDLEVREIAVEPVFAGEPIRIRVGVRPAAGDPRDLLIRCSEPRAEPGTWQRFSAAASGNGAVATLTAPSGQRGFWQVPRLRIEQRAPFGLLKAWVWLYPTTRGLVWPRPAGSRPVPPSDGDLRGEQAQRAGLDEFAGLRPFREGDSPRQVAWKAYARGAPLLVREYHDALGRQRRLDYAALPGVDIEARLAQLAQWILDAERCGDPWSLHLPDVDLPLDTGAAHRRAGLDALALA